MKRSKKTSKQNRDQGDSFETKLGRRLGMQKQPGSGCGRIFKEDLVDEAYLAQAKSTRSSRITVKRSDLTELRKNAKDKTPVMFIGFFDKERIEDDDIWAVVPLRHWTRRRERE